MNNDLSILPNHKLVPIGINSSMNSKYEGIQSVCDLVKKEIVTILGPMTTSSVKASHPLCLGLHMPMITPSATDPMLRVNNSALKISN